MATKKVDGVKQKPVDTEATTVEHRVVACNAQFIAVDAGKLSKGLKTTFEGVAMVFDSIGLPVQLGLTMDLEDESDGTADAEPTASAVAAEQTESAVSTEKVAVKKEAKAESKSESASEPTLVADTQEEAVSEEPAPVAEPAPDAKNTPAAPVISVDDITKIIVQKIRQNRNTNEKIAAILKTYGVAKVSELPADKYEAFLTDLSAI